MSKPTALLIRYGGEKGSHVYLGSAGRERYIEMGVATKETAERIGRDILSNSNATAVKNIYRGLVLETEQIPGATWYLNDHMGPDLIVGATASMDQDGIVEAAPELTDPLTLRMEALERQVQAAGRGTRSPWGRPEVDTQAQGDATTNTPDTVTFDTYLAAALTEDATGDPDDPDDDLSDFSNVWTAKGPFHMAFVDLNLKKPGTSASQVSLYRWTADDKEGTASLDLVKNCFIGKDKRRSITRIDETWKADESLVWRIRSAGNGALGLTIIPRGASV